MKGFGGFESWDETYVHRRHNDEDRMVLEVREQGMQARGKTSEPWTWIRTHGKGRVFYTAWGHDLRTWNNPGFQNLVERGIRWACGGDPGWFPGVREAGADDSADDARARRDWRRTRSEVGPSARPRSCAQSRFVPPTMVDGGGDLEDFEYDDVGPAVPHYRPAAAARQQRRGPRGGGREHHQMQRPVSPEKSHNVSPSGPKGFEIELYAVGGRTWARSRSRSTGTPAVGLWVCETIDYPNEWRRSGEGRDRIRICEDTDGDGKADKFTVFAENLSIPYTLAFYRGGVIVQNGGYTIYLKDTDGDDKADVRKTLITGWGMGDTHGTVSNFQYGLDNWIYAMQGYNASTPRFVDAEGDEAEVPEFRQGFFRFRLDAERPAERG